MLKPKLKLWFASFQPFSTTGTNVNMKPNLQKKFLKWNTSLLPSFPHSLMPSRHPSSPSCFFRCVWEKPIGRSPLRVDSMLLRLGMPTMLIGVTIYGPSVCEQASTHKSAHSLVNPKRSHMFHPPTATLCGCFLQENQLQNFLSMNFSTI